MKTINLRLLRELRQKKGLTQAQIAQALGYKSELGYHYLESGRCQIKANHLPLLAAILEVDIDMLFKSA